MQSIIVNPNTDPHSYEPTASDGIALAKSQMAIVNGIGYDKWASKLLAANPSSSRAVLDVGDLLGLRQGDNPHQWYSPSSVQRVIDADRGRLPASSTPRTPPTSSASGTIFETRDSPPTRHMISSDPGALRRGPGGRTARASSNRWARRSGSSC